MDTKRLLLAGGMIIVAAVVFLQVRKMATPVRVEVPAAASSEPAAAPVTVTRILAATGEIPFGTRLTSDNFKWVEWPSEIVSGEFIAESNRSEAIMELTGSVARSVIFENEPISERKLVKPGTQGLMATMLKAGMRAVTTRISVDTAAGGFIQPGDRVDIILTTSMTPSAAVQARQGPSQIFTASTIFENVRVLAIDQTFSTSAESGASVIGSTATFEMSQEDSEVLQEAVAQGDITLTLRPMGPVGRASGKSHARIRKNSGEVSSLTVYRGGQATQVAIQGQ